MAILAIDTAGPDCAVALARPASGALHILGRETARVGRGHSDLLIPMIARVLRDADHDYSDLTVIAVTVGPGSFTGIRAGIAAARGLALALDIPAVGVGVLEAMAAACAAPSDSGVVVAALDARRGEIFAYAIEAETGLVLLQAVAGEPDELAAQIAALVADRLISLTGSGAGPLADALMKAGKIASVRDHAETADIASVAEIGFRSPPGALPVPFYLRDTDAKVQSGKAVARR